MIDFFAAFVCYFVIPAMALIGYIWWNIFLEHRKILAIEKAADEQEYHNIEIVAKMLAETARVATEDSEKLMRYLERKRAKRKSE